MAGTNLRWLLVPDFKAGVYLSDSGFTGDVNAPLGAASNMKGVIASATGALVPGPLIIDTITQTLPEGHAGDTNYWPAQDNQYHLGASHMVSPMVADAAYPTAPQPLYPDALFVAWSYFYDPTGTGNYKQYRRIREYKIYADATGAVSYDVNAVGPTTVAYPFPQGYFDFTTALQTPTLGTVVNYGGRPIVVALAFQPPTAAAHLYSFPHSTTPTVDSVFTATPGSPFQGYTLVLTHQDRVVWVANAANGAGDDFGSDGAGGATSFVTYNHLSFTDPFDFESVNFQQLAFDSENRSGITAIVSMNAGELFYVKASGGGGTIKGDLFLPQVTVLRTIHSTGDVRVKPAVTPFGVVYVGIEGAYLWTGGDASTKISYQLGNSKFWNLSNSFVADHLGLQGQCEYVDPWVLVPGGWMYDTRFQSWWKLDGGPENSSYFSYHVNANGIVYALPPLTGPSQTVVARRFYFGMGTRAPTWTWTSVPINPSSAATGQDYAKQHLGDQETRVQRLRMVLLYASAYSTGATIAVTIISDSGASTPVTVTIDGSDKRYRWYRVDFGEGVDGTSFQIALNASGAGVNAPSVAQMNLGFEDIGSLAEAG